MCFNVINVQRCSVAVRSLQGKHLAFHSRSPQAATVAIGRHADATNYPEYRQIVPDGHFLRHNDDSNITFGTHQPAGVVIKGS